MHDASDRLLPPITSTASTHVSWVPGWSAPLSRWPARRWPGCAFGAPSPQPNEPGDQLAFHDALIASADPAALEWWALFARHIPRDRTSGIPVASLARPAGTWLSPISRRDGPVALDARKVSGIAETASTPAPVKRTTLSRSGMPSIGQRPSKICALASTVRMGLFRFRGRQLDFNVFLPPRTESRRPFARVPLWRRLSTPQVDSS